MVNGIAKLTLQALLLGSLLFGRATCSQRRKELLSYAHVDAASSPIPNNVQINPGANSTTLTPQFFPNHGSKRVELKYGPFPVIPMSQNNGMADYLQINAQMPCTDCTITYMAASMEYPDGSYANANTSLWLHHIVLINLNNPDTVCGKNYYAKGERWFASGNERTPANICKNGTIPAGYYLGANDNVLLVVELMNQAMYDQTAVPTIIFEYIEGRPSDFYSAVPIWLDIGGCDIASDMPAKSNSTFMYKAPPYHANFSGVVTGMGGHLHDGGTHLEIIRNGEEVCSCIPYYGQTPGYWDVPGSSMIMPMTPNFSPMDHISSISGCSAPASMIEPGDEWTISAYYNFTEYNPMVNVDGSLADIMGISIVYVAADMTHTEMASYVGTTVAPLAPVPEPTSVALMAMSMQSGKAHMGQMVMSCIPYRDSPGTITTAGLNMANRHVAMTYLMAILNDTCLQAWSKNYVRALWCGIVVVICLFTITRGLQWAKLTLKKRNAAANRPNTAGLAGTLTASTSLLTSVLRGVSYPQVSQTSLSSIVKDEALPTASGIFRAPPLGTTLMIVAYVGALMVLEFLHVSTGDNQTWQLMGVRAAWLTVGQVPLIVLLAGKRNLIGLFTGVSYERLNVLHRWVARCLLLTATMHFGFPSYGWAKAGVMQLEWSADTCPPRGIAAYSILLWINLSNLPPFRNMCYELFVIQHIISFMGLIIAIMIHIPPTALHARIYIYIAVALYLTSRLVQTAIYAYRNMRPARATTISVSDSVTQITVKNSNLQCWRPGSFVLLSIPRHGVFQSHPFTIASTPASENGNLTFLLRKRGGFTSRIVPDSSQAVALIDGPYGGQQSDLAAFQTVVLFAGSTGISFVLPILLDIGARASTARLPVQEIHLAWATKDHRFVLFLEGTLKGAIHKLRDAGINVSATIHITGVYKSSITSDSEKSETSSNSEISLEKSEALSNQQNLEGMETEKQEHVQTKISQVRTTSTGSSSTDRTQSAIPLTIGRPSLKSVLDAACSRSTEEMAVAVCGPHEMSSEVRNIVSSMELHRESGHHGVYLHVEGFSW